MSGQAYGHMSLFRFCLHQKFGFVIYLAFVGILSNRRLRFSAYEPKAQEDIFGAQYPLPGSQLGRQYFGFRESHLGLDSSSARDTTPNCRREHIAPMSASVGKYRVTTWLEFSAAVCAYKRVDNFQRAWLFERKFD